MVSPTQQTQKSEADTISDPTKRIVEVELTKDEKTGLGFNIAGGSDEPYIPGHNGIFISRIRKDGEAARDGRLRPGDRIVAVNEHVLSGKTHNEAVEIFKQATGKVKLLIEQDAETIVLSKPANILPTPLGGSPTNDPVLKSILKSTTTCTSSPSNSATDIHKDKENKMTATVTLPAATDSNVKTTVEFKEDKLSNGSPKATIVVKPKHQEAKDKPIQAEIPLEATKTNTLANGITTKTNSPAVSNLTPSNVVLPSHAPNSKNDEDDDGASTISVAPSTHSIIDDVPRTPKKPISILDPARKAINSITGLFGSAVRRLPFRRS